jgi:hypothetical protein
MRYFTLFLSLFLFSCDNQMTVNSKSSAQTNTSTNKALFSVWQHDDKIIDLTDFTFGTNYPSHSAEISLSVCVLSHTRGDGITICDQYENQTVTGQCTQSISIYGDLDSGTIQIQTPDIGTSCDAGIPGCNSAMHSVCQAIYPEGSYNYRKSTDDLEICGTECVEFK